jgi:hypothetical protein
MFNWFKKAIKSEPEPFKVKVVGYGDGTYHTIQYRENGKWKQLYKFFCLYPEKFDDLQADFPYMEPFGVAVSFARTLKTIEDVRAFEKLQKDRYDEAYNRLKEKLDRKLAHKNQTWEGP